MTTLHFGVLLTNPRGDRTHGVGPQLLDVAVVDIFTDLSKEYVSGVILGDGVQQFLPVAIDVETHYIADSLEPVRLTAGAKIVPTDTYETCPRLDYLLVPGAMSAYRASDAEIKFIQERHPEVKALFGICTGPLIIGASGVADGRRGTGNRAIVEWLQQEFPKGHWSAEYRWVADEEAKLWTCGGAQTAIDMMTAYIKQHFHADMVDFVLKIGEFEIRQQKYP